MEHPWLRDPKVGPVLALPDLLPDSLKERLKGSRMDRADGKNDDSFYQEGNRTPVQSTQVSQMAQVSGCASPGGSVGVVPISGGPPTGPITWMGGSAELPSWSAAMRGGIAPVTPTQRARSPPRSPRAAPPRTQLPAPLDRQMLERDRRAVMPAMPARLTQVSTAHSPAPALQYQSQAGSPMHIRPQAGASMRTASPMGGFSNGQRFPAQPALIRSYSPKGGSGAAVAQSASDRGRTWTFRSDSGGSGSNAGGETDGNVGPSPYRNAAAIPPRARAASPMQAMQAGMRPTVPVPRTAQSPPRKLDAGAIIFPRSMSPGDTSPSYVSGGSVRAAMNARAASPGAGFSWTQATAPLSPRASAQPTAMQRTASPVAQYAAKPLKQGFAWSPDPPSPRVSARSFSPAPIAISQHSKQIPNNVLPRWSPHG